MADLEEERRKLRMEMKFRAKYHGQHALEMGLSNEQLLLLEQYADDLKHNRVEEARVVEQLTKRVSRWRRRPRAGDRRRKGAMGVAASGAWRLPRDLPLALHQASKPVCEGRALQPSDPPFIVRQVEFLEVRLAEVMAYADIPPAMRPALSEFDPTGLGEPRKTACKGFGVSWSASCGLSLELPGLLKEPRARLEQAPPGVPQAPSVDGSHTRATTTQRAARPFQLASSTMLCPRRQLSLCCARRTGGRCAVTAARGRCVGHQGKGGGVRDALGCERQRSSLWVPRARTVWPARLHVHKGFPAHHGMPARSPRWRP